MQIMLLLLFLLNNLHTATKVMFQVAIALIVALCRFLDEENYNYVGNSKSEANEREACHNK